MTKQNKIYWFIVTVVFTMMNIIGTQSSSLNHLLYFLEYALIVFFALKQPTKGFIFYILFASVTLEFDTFIYINETAPFRRLTLFTSPSIFIVVTLLVLITVYNDNKQFVRLKTWSKDSIWLFRFIVFLGGTGIVAFVFSYLLNDNNIKSLPVYPEEFFTQLRQFLLLVCTFVTTILLMQDRKKREFLKDSSLSILLGIAFSTIVSILIGYRGYYSTQEIMLAPLVVCFAPCIFAFLSKEKDFYWFELSVVLLIVSLSISCPNAMGSKWYLIIFAALLYLLWSKLRVKSKWLLLLIAIVGIYFIPLIGSLLEGYLSSSSEFGENKFSQAMGMLDFFSSGSFEGWFLSLDRSAQFRVDEPWNILIEYENKPYFALFGKGFAGAITQHTAFLDWAGPGAFNDIQAGRGIYYNMHESFATIFLHHGIIGIYFFIAVLIKLFKRMRNPWALFGLLWFFFFWAYGVSFRLGAVAFAIAFAEKYSNNGRD